MTSDKNLFMKELDTLVSAQRDLQNLHLFSAEEIKTHYVHLVREYEKLLKLSIKIFKISDIQGKTLKEKENEIEFMNEQLRKKEELRKQLVSDISHELGSPITAIQLHLKAMIDGIIMPDQNYLTKIYDDIGMVNKLVEDLFELSKMEANQVRYQYERVSIKSLGKEIKLKYDLDINNRGFQFIFNEFQNIPRCEDIYLVIDRFRIEQVFTNLIYNAFKYSSEHGTIQIAGEMANSHMIISVKDDGAGIEEEAIPFVFDRFYRRSSANLAKISGSGLGLAIVKEIIKQHGGEIGVKSKLGEGSTFYFTIPLVEEGIRNRGIFYES